MDSYSSFLRAFPCESYAPVDAFSLKTNIALEFGIELPKPLLHLYETVGTGYFADRELYIFGDGQFPSPRPSLIEWNKEPFWSAVYPPQAAGGPLWFAETCFGEQLGYRWEAGKCLIILFVVDDFQSFLLCDDPVRLFSELLTERYAITDRDHLRTVKERLGPLPDGMHYAPIVPPLVGGSDNPTNYHLEPGNLHFKLAIETYRSIYGP